MDGCDIGISGQYQFTCTRRHRSDRILPGINRFPFEPLFAHPPGDVFFPRLPEQETPATIIQEASDVTVRAQRFNYRKQHGMREARYFAGP